MFVSRNSNHLKLIDFGFSKTRRKSGEKMKTDCGTLSYIAPEVLEKEYTNQCDIWSLGVIVYILLSGKMPFFGSDAEQIKNIKKGQYDMEAKQWSRISGDATVFVQALMRTDPAERLTAEGALQHVWLERRSPKARACAHSSLVRALSTLCSHVLEPQFRRCCRKMVARMLPNEQQAKVYDLFAALDATCIGTVAIGKWLEGECIGNEVLKGFSVTDKAILYESELEYSDFLAALVSSELCVADDVVACVFRKFDLEKSGRITRGQLESVIGDVYEDVDEELMLPEFQHFVWGSTRLSLPLSSMSSSGLSTSTRQTALLPRQSLADSAVSTTWGTIFAVRDATAASPESQCQTPLTPFARTPGSTPIRSHLRASCRGFDHIVEADRSPDTYPVLLARSSLECKAPFSSSKDNSSAAGSTGHWPDPTASGTACTRGDQCQCTCM
jgi:Ca2+-binding EF-hand superfamily protein